MAHPLHYPLRIRLLRGRHLRRSDWTTGESDPYAEVWLAEGGQKQRTRVASNTRCPLWNHDFSFTLTSGDVDTLHLQIYDEDVGKRDELLGELTIPVSKLMHLAHEPSTAAAGSGSTGWPGCGLSEGVGVGRHAGPNWRGHPAPPPGVSAAGHGHPMAGPVYHGANPYPPQPPVSQNVDAYGRALPPPYTLPPSYSAGWSPTGFALQSGFTYPPPAAPPGYGLDPSYTPCRSASNELSTNETSPKKSSRRTLSSSLSGMSLGKVRDSLIAMTAHPGGDAPTASSSGTVSSVRVHGVPSRPSRHASGGSGYNTHFFAETPSVHHADTPLLSAPLLAAGYTAEWYPLTPERCGEIAIAVVPDERLARRRCGPYWGVPSLPVNIPFQVFHASLLTKAAIFPTYTLQLHSVRSVFGSIRCPWNKNYPAAQQIFASTPQAFVARGLIKAQHARLCGGGIALDDGVVSTVRRALAGLTGAIATAPEFFALVHNGIRGGKSRFFTYVLLAGDRAGSARLRFSETGASFFDDARSKHAVHSNAAEEVVYSGEFHIRTHARETPEAPGAAVVAGSTGPPPRPPTLVLDNGSGTYAPGKEHLPLLQQVFRRNFPDMDVQAVDFQGPVVLAAKQEIKDYDII